MQEKTVLALLCMLVAVGFKDPDPDTTPIYENVAAELAAYPKDYFRSPVLTDIRLTGTFGELRPNHFHSGIDLKSATGKVGQSVVAAAEGYVSRINVSAGGYGNAVYIKHPNGYTTVYAHLDRFSPAIEAELRKKQYALERFAVDFKPAEGALRVSKGQEIGKLGNSGSSSGPHLHFEIRHTATGKVLNPELFGLPVPDDVPPDIRDLKVYFLNDKREVQAEKNLQVAAIKPGSYKLKGADTLLLGAWRVGFGLKVYDSMSGFDNDNGVFAINMKVNDQTAFLFRMDELDFDETRYHNAHIDYPAKHRGEGYFHRCYLMPGNRLSNYARTENAGMVSLFSEKTTKIELIATDASGNTSSLVFWVQRDADNMQTFQSKTYHFELPLDAETTLTPPNLIVEFPKNTFYETVYMPYHITQDASHHIFSDIHHLGDEAQPVHRYFKLSIMPYHLPDELRSKAIIAQCRAKKHENCGAQWTPEGFLTTKIRNFGDFCVTVDTEPPSIVPVNFSRDMRKKSSIIFKIDDNFDISGSADDLSYRGTIDGKWVLFEYDKKRKRLEYVFDEKTPSGTHTLKLVVSDDRNNRAVFEQEFLR